MRPEKITGVDSREIAGLESASGRCLTRFVSEYGSPGKA